MKRISGEDDSAPGFDGLEALGGGGVAVLDSMSFVADDQVWTRTRQRLAHLRKDERTEIKTDGRTNQRPDSG